MYLIYIYNIHIQIKIFTKNMYSSDSSVQMSNHASPVENVLSSAPRLPREIFRSSAALRTGAKVKGLRQEHPHGQRGKFVGG